jgi:hypothetical protein
METLELIVNLPVLHPKQQSIKESRAKRKVIRAGRRGGKTTLAADIAIDAFLDGRRVLYATPTQEQIDRFWFECKNALKEPLDAGVYYKNETRHIIEFPGTEQRIRGKTAWNADTLRGDYGDEVLLDEFQDMNPNALDLVVYPMLLDNDGNLILIYTKKRGKQGKYASDLYKRAEEDETGRWGAFTFTSHDNPHLSKDALSEITQDMTNLAYRMEIMAEDIGDDPNALWNRELINENRVLKAPELIRVVVGVDPPGGQRTECGIVVAGSAMVDDELHAFVIDDPSLTGSPGEWARATVTSFHRNLADRIVGEVNYGGDMVESTLRAVDPEVSYKAVRATRGKAVRAEPVVAQYERGKVHHVGEFGELEDEQCNWVPESGMLSPNRLDALVWAITELLGDGGVWDVY